MNIKKCENMDVITYNNKRYILFFGYKCPFSNMYNTKINYKNQEFNCVEQIFAYEKAMLFEPSAANNIKNCKYGAEAKKLGSRVKNFNPKIWDNNREIIMKNALTAKFNNNPRLKKIIRTY